MAGNSPAEAVQAFVAPIKEALGCFTRGKITADSYDPRRSGILVLNAGEEAQLDGPERLRLSVTMHYQIVKHADPAKGPWKVTTTGWMYDLARHDGATIYAYHWHPVSKSHVTVPHLHIAAQKAHVPTGRILIEDVLDAACDIGAEPHDPKTWNALALANRQKFQRGATWGTPSV